MEEPDGTVNVYPDLSERIQTASVDYIKSAIGVSEIESSEIASLLNRMSLPAVLKGDEVQVRVPITRSGILSLLSLSFFFIFFHSFHSFVCSFLFSCFVESGLMGCIHYARL